MWPTNPKELPSPGLEYISQLGLDSMCNLTIALGSQTITQSFHIHRSQKQKKTDSLTEFFALLGSLRVKADCKHVIEIDPISLFQFVKPFLNERIKNGIIFHPNLESLHQVCLYFLMIEELSNLKLGTSQL